MKKFIAPVMVLVVAGCASTHDISKGNSALGGGVSSQEVLPGLHHVLARTNFAPWENYGAARKSWKAVAEKACKGVGYKELGVKESARDTGAPRATVFGYIVTEKDGYALCGGATTSEQQASDFLSARSAG